jgi:hypothetical protein
VTGGRVAACLFAVTVTGPLLAFSIAAAVWDAAREWTAPRPLSAHERADVIARIDALNAQRKGSIFVGERGREISKGRT